MKHCLKLVPSCEAPPQRVMFFDEVTPPTKPYTAKEGIGGNSMEQDCGGDSGERERSSEEDEDPSPGPRKKKRQKQGKGRRMKRTE